VIIGSERFRPRHLSAKIGRKMKTCGNPRRIRAEMTAGRWGI
jgi:hypothetical protein